VVLGRRLAVALIAFLTYQALAIREVAAAVFRPDNRVVLTYLPEASPADDVSLTETEVDEATTDEEVAA